jgi:hypothetical protein
MKTALYGLMLTALLAAGCIPQAPFVWPGDGATSGEQAQPERKHTPAVRADQVTAENAHQMAQQVEEELENDREAPLPK